MSISVQPALECLTTCFCLLGKSLKIMNKKDIIKTIKKSNITAERKKEIIDLIRKSNIPTSEKRIIIKTIKTGTKEDVILALMYILYIAKDFFDKFNT